MINVYKKDDNGPYELTSKHDPDSQVIYAMRYKPSLWTPSTVLFENEDVVLPTTETGFYYEVKSTGVTGASEPTWATETRDKVLADGTVDYVTRSYNFLLGYNETLISSEWSATTGVTLSNDSNTSSHSQVRVDAVTSTLTEFILTNRITKSTGGVIETFDHSFLIKIGDL